MTEPDARGSNWRFVVPTGDAVPVILDDGQALREAGLRDRSSPAVVLPDVALWKASPTSVLDLAAAAVAEGGWLCVGFANRLFPAAGTGL